MQLTRCGLPLVVMTDEAQWLPGPHSGADVLVSWRGGHDMPLPLLFRMSPHGDPFTCLSGDLTSVKATAAAGSGKPGRKNLKRRRIGE